MVIETIRELNRAAPFRPYKVRLASGVVHQVPRPDFIAVAPKGSWVIISDENDHPYWINALLIEEVTLASPESKKN